MQRFSHLVTSKRAKHSKDSSSPNHQHSSPSHNKCFLWAWGNLSHHIPAKHKQQTPLLAESLDTERIASITCDSRHIIVVTRDGVIFLWELGKSLKRISKKCRYSNFKNRPESLDRLVTMMRNQLPIVSHFEISAVSAPSDPLHHHHDHGSKTRARTRESPSSTLNVDISQSLNKRIFYGSDAVKWVVEHEAVDDEAEGVRFCQALLNEGRMECANRYRAASEGNGDSNGDISGQSSGRLLFQNSRSGLYYFSDSRKKLSSNYMQKFHAVPADPTLKFNVVASNKHHFYTVDHDGNLFEWDLRRRSRELRDKFLAKQRIERIRSQFQSGKHRGNLQGMPSHYGQIRGNGVSAVSAMNVLSVKERVTEKVEEREMTGTVTRNLRYFVGSKFTANYGLSRCQSARILSISNMEYAVSRDTATTPTSSRTMNMNMTMTTIPSPVRIRSILRCQRRIIIVHRVH